jgi:putative ABC transport system substrate-binding protein
VALGQQSPRVPRISALINASSADDPLGRERLQTFREAMQAAGWTEGKNITVDYRFVPGDLARTSAAAAEVVALAPDLLYGQGLAAAQALHQKTRTIPIVFTLVVDPVGFGLVASLAHPGGNVTGFMVFEPSMGGKWMQLLVEIAPEARRVGIVYDPDTAPYAPAFIVSARAAAGRDVAVIECPVHDDSEIEGAISSIGHEPHGGFLVVPSAFTGTHRDQFIALAAHLGLPSLIPLPGAVEQGALLSYLFDYDAVMRQPVAYIDRILKGESPSNLPVQAPTKYQLAINLKTAKALGLTVPVSLLATADKVVEEDLRP